MYDLKATQTNVKRNLIRGNESELRHNDAKIIKKKKGIVDQKMKVHVITVQ